MLLSDHGVRTVRIVPLHYSCHECVQIYYENKGGKWTVNNNEITNQNYVIELNVGYIL